LSTTNGIVFVLHPVLLVLAVTDEVDQVRRAALELFEQLVDQRRVQPLALHQAQHHRGLILGAEQGVLGVPWGQYEAATQPEALPARSAVEAGVAADCVQDSER
jgi:hypothetical protein